MTSQDIKEFAERLNAELDAERVQSRSGYLHFNHLAQSIQRGANPAGAANAKFPQMVYRAGENRIVNGVEELSQALDEGWSETAPPPYEEGFPRWFCEKPTSLFGRKVYDLRRVQINNSEQERQLFAVIDSDEWMGDSVNSLWGARGVALADLVQEHKEQLKRLIDNDALEIVEPPAEPAADAESGSEER